MNEEIESILIEKDISPTAMRILVLEYLQKQSAAISLQDLERDFQHSDRITLYRTLKTFEEKGLIHSINDGTDATKYAKVLLKFCLVRFKGAIIWLGLSTESAISKGYAINPYWTSNEALAQTK